MRERRRAVMQSIRRGQSCGLSSGSAVAEVEADWR